jgi:uroporphyrinogen decarboxylase
VIYKELKPVQGMPHWLDYPVHNRAEWERFRAERFRPDLAERVPQNWSDLIELYKVRDYPLALGSSMVGFFGMPRQILGLELLLTSLCEAPGWMHEMMDYLADFYVSLYDQVLCDVQVDFAALWEDMCYVAGPLISPRMFAEFMLPPYKKLVGFLRDHGIDIIFVDTDGDARQLIPLFLEAGVTAMYPFEANSTMDVGAIRKQYPKLGMAGGIDKKALAAGKAAIDRELDLKVPVALGGGYIPYVDHATPPDVPWENFCYYRRKLDAMLDEYDEENWEARKGPGK